MKHLCIYAVVLMLFATACTSRQTEKAIENDSITTFDESKFPQRLDVPVLDDITEAQNAVAEIESKYDKGERATSSETEDAEITQLLNEWEGYINQYYKEIEEVTEAGGRGIPGLFIYEDEERCFKRLSGMVNQMSPSQKAQFDRLNAICNDELAEYLPRIQNPQ